MRSASPRAQHLRLSQAWPRDVRRGATQHLRREYASHIDDTTSAGTGFLARGISALSRWVARLAELALRSVLDPTYGRCLTQLTALTRPATLVPDLPDIDILPFSRAGDLAAVEAAMEAIFFAASATQSFSDAATKAAFRERWLGRFLVHFTEGTFVAVERGTGKVVGYVIGAVRDPAHDPRFADIAYFKDLAHLTAQYPAHLHINLAEHARNRGLGGRLIEAFAAHAREHGAPGVHVVTSKASRNRTFYTRQGFELLATLGEPGREIVMLGRRM